MSTKNQFINHVIKEINELTDVIYEELYEEQSKELIPKIQELIQLLNSIVKDYDS